LLLIYLTETLRSETSDVQNNTNLSKVEKQKRKNLSEQVNIHQLTSTNNQQSATSSTITIKSTREAFETTSTTRQIV